MKGKFNCYPNVSCSSSMNGKIQLMLSNSGWNSLFLLNVPIKNDTAERSSESLFWGIIVCVDTGGRVPSAESLIFPAITALSCQQCLDVGGQDLLLACEIWCAQPFLRKSPKTCYRADCCSVVLRKLHL